MRSGYEFFETDGTRQGYRPKVTEFNYSVIATDIKRPINSPKARNRVLVQQPTDVPMTETTTGRRFEGPEELKAAKIQRGCGSPSPESVGSSHFGGNSMLHLQTGQSSNLIKKVLHPQKQMLEQSEPVS